MQSDDEPLEDDIDGFLKLLKQAAGYEIVKSAPDDKLYTKDEMLQLLINVGKPSFLAGELTIFKKFLSESSDDRPGFAGDYMDILSYLVTVMLYLKEREQIDPAVMEAWLKHNPIDFV